MRANRIAYVTQLIILVFTGCRAPESVPRSDAPDKPIDWGVVRISEKDMPVKGHPCVSITAVEWLENDELVFAEEGRIWGWDVGQGIPLWVERSPVIDELNSSDFTHGTVFRMEAPKKGGDLLVSGYLDHGPRALFHTKRGGWTKKLLELPYETNKESCCIGNIRDAIWRPDGTQYAISGNDYIEVFNSDGTPASHFTSSHSANCGEYRRHRVLAWSPDGSTLAGLRCPLGPLELWNVDTGRVVGTVERPGRLFTGATWGRSLVATTSDGEVLGSHVHREWKHRLWVPSSWPDFLGGGFGFNHLWGVWGNRIEVDNSGELFSISDVTPGFVVLFSWKGGEVFRTQAEPGQLSPDGRTIASVYECSHLKLIDVPTKKELVNIALDGDCNLHRKWSWSPSGKYLSAVSKHQQLYLFDISTRKMLNPICEVVDKHNIRGKLIEAGDISVIAR